MNFFLCGGQNELISSFVGFSAPKLHTYALAAILYTFCDPHPSINELVLVTGILGPPCNWASPPSPNLPVGWGAHHELGR